LHIAEEALKGIQGEDSVSALEREKRQLQLQVDIERLKKEFKEVNNPPPPPRSSRNILHVSDDDE
jgi:hypothetical protein